jgi:IS30 family transposase
VLGVSESPVLRVLRAAGLAGPQQTTKALRREEIREKILLLRKKGASGDQIARELNLPIGRIYTALNRASGLDPRFNLGTSHLTSDELKTVADLRTQQVSIAEIAQRLGRSERTIFRAIAKLGGSNGVRQLPPPSVDRG